MSQSSAVDPGNPTKLMVSPSICQIVTFPVRVFNQNTSAFPSALTSPIPANFSSDGGACNTPVDATVAPSMIQTDTFPVLALRQKISTFSLPSKSPTPLMTQSFEAEPGNPIKLMRLPCIIQMATTPLITITPDDISGPIAIQIAASCNLPV